MWVALHCRGYATCMVGFGMMHYEIVGGVPVKCIFELLPPLIALAMVYRVKYGNLVVDYEVRVV